MKLLNNFCACVALTSLLLLVGCGETTTSGTNTQETIPKTTFQCPMKCEGDKVYQSNVSCPICHMELKEVSQV